MGELADRHRHVEGVREVGQAPVLDASWIEPVESAEAAARNVRRPAYHLVGTVVLDVAPTSAAIRITAHGLYELFVNGCRVGDEELRPGFTSYRTRLQVQSYDVTSLLRAGDNAVGVLLSDGWWRGQNAGARWTNSYGSTVGALAELSVDGRAVLATDSTWRSTVSHIVEADLVAGEVHDLRRRVPGWSEPGTDRSSWAPVLVADHPLDNLAEPVGPPVRRIQELPAAWVRAVAPGRHLVDFGQNSNGWIRLADLGPEGTTITIVHGEVLTPDGDDVSIDAIASISASDNPPTHVPPVPFQTDTVVSAGDGSVFEPRHSTKGFRYVRIDGHPGPLSADSISSIVVHSDLAPIGGFWCSDERINALHRAADWGFRTNACEVPTDCPQRERSGWTGDWQVFVDSAAYLYDVTGFSSRWLLDVAAEQLANGAVTNIVPDPTDLENAPPDWTWPRLQGSAGWGDAGVHVPWALYRATGRVEVIEQQLDSMRRWVDFAARRAERLRHPERAERRPEPQPHERYLWDGGFHFGEWAEPAGSTSSGMDLATRIRLDQGPTATAFLCRSAEELAELLAAVDRPADAERYAELAANVRRAWQLEYLADDGRVIPSTQANLVRALAFHLLPADCRALAASDLVALISDADGHLGTGFLSTPYLLPVLADTGHLDVAYELLFTDTPPSWLYMLDQGATTIWENWEGFSASGKQVASHNHYSKGAVISFLHRYVAGVDVIDPGYRKFSVCPHPGGGITAARTHHDSPYGRVEVAWTLESGIGAVDVTVPSGTACELMLPDGQLEELASGSHRRQWSR